MTRKTTWKPGQSGNPAGRPRGSLNHSTRAVLALMDGEAESIARVAIEAAKGGDLTAARLVLDKLIPTAKERAIELPDLPDTSSALGVSEAQQRVLEEVANGSITPGEASTLSGVLEARRRALETLELETRIAALEGKAK
ncbi:MAG: hypothetical protein JSS47_03275 [Proteobacteria bacterium]|nr:hypothetical protein [Pseudomonadota bacterium]